jgi:hypothetical protein
MKQNLGILQSCSLHVHLLYSTYGSSICQFVRISFPNFIRYSLFLVPLIMAMGFPGPRKRRVGS